MSAIDTTIGFIFLAALAFCIIVTQMIYNVMNVPAITGLFAENEQAAKAMPAAGTALGIFDGIFLLVMVGVVMGGVVAAFLVKSHPIFFILMLLVNVALVVISVMFSNSFESFINTSAGTSAAANTFPMMVFAMRHLPILSLIGIVIVAVYSATHGEG